MRLKYRDDGSSCPDEKNNIALSLSHEEKLSTMSTVGGVPRSKLMGEF